MPTASAEEAVVKSLEGVIEAIKRLKGDRAGGEVSSLAVLRESAAALPEALLEVADQLEGLLLCNVVENFLTLREFERISQQWPRLLSLRAKNSVPPERFLHIQKRLCCSLLEEPADGFIFQLVEMAAGQEFQWKYSNELLGRQLAEYPSLFGQQEKTRTLSGLCKRLQWFSTVLRRSCTFPERWEMPTRLKNLFLATVQLDVQENFRSFLATGTEFEESLQWVSEWERANQISQSGQFLVLLDDWGCLLVERERSQWIALDSDRDWRCGEPFSSMAVTADRLEKAIARFGAFAGKKTKDRLLNALDAAIRCLGTELVHSGLPSRKSCCLIQPEISQAFAVFNSLCWLRSFAAEHQQYFQASLPLLDEKVKIAGHFISLLALRDLEGILQSHSLKGDFKGDVSECAFEVFRLVEAWKGMAAGHFESPAIVMNRVYKRVALRLESWVFSVNEASWAVPQMLLDFQYLSLNNEAFAVELASLVAICKGLLMRSDREAEIIFHKSRPTSHSLERGVLEKILALRKKSARFISAPRGSAGSARC